MALLQLSPLICPVQDYRRRLRFSFRLPPMRLVAVRMNSRTRCRFNAHMTPIRASIVGPPFSATKISASIADCHGGAV
jgi:hypothetical protein